MANEQNLIPGQHKLTLEEQLMGGIKSGEARRKKKQMKETMQMLLSLKVPSKEFEEKLIEAGVPKEELTAQSAILYRQIHKAMGGNTESAKFCRDTAGEYIGAKEEEKVEIKGKVLIPAEHIALPFIELNRKLDGSKTLEVMLPGGRGSTKSSYWSEKLVELLENNPTWCAIVLRRVGNTLNQSVKPQIEWGIDKLSECYPDITKDWDIPKTGLDITKQSTNQKIYLRGADDPGKIKSIKPPPGKYIAIIVYEEFDQFNGMEDIRKINQSIKRGGDVFIEFDAFNTPRSKQHFANRELLLPKKDRIVVPSDYTQVPAEWLGEKFIDDAEWLKENNPLAYENEYLGKAVGDGGAVFENLEIREITDEEVKTFDRIYNGVDWGWYPDPWAFNKMHFDTARRTLYIFDEAEANKKSNRETADILINEHQITSADLITCDSAEKKSTADYRAFGLFARDAEKGPGSVEYSMKWLATLFKIVIDPIRCPRTAQEFSEYELEKDKEGNYLSGYPDKNNHHIDACRYGLESIWRVRGE